MNTSEAKEPKRLASCGRRRSSSSSAKTGRRLMSMGEASLFFGDTMLAARCMSGIQARGRPGALLLACAARQCTAMHRSIDCLLGAPHSHAPESRQGRCVGLVCTNEPTPPVTDDGFTVFMPSPSKASLLQPPNAQANNNNSSSQGAMSERGGGRGGSGRGGGEGGRRGRGGRGRGRGGGGGRGQQGQQQSGGGGGRARRNEYEDEFDVAPETRQIKGDEEDDYGVAPGGGGEDAFDDDEDGGDEGGREGRRMTKQFAWEEDRMEEEVCGFVCGCCGRFVRATGD